MALAKYNQKRNFKITAEPKGKIDRHQGKPIFVIQEHHASRLHWDFRLEADGVLKSWAVTKEPTLDPSIKRLAVQVEDHPLPYAKFHGDIPSGQYGAGHVEIWDKGTYENLEANRPKKPRSVASAIENGKIEVELHGKKLNGAYALVRMNGKAGGPRGQNWLLIKKRDQFAEEGNQKSEDASHKRNPDKPARSRVATTAQPDFRFSNVEKVMFPEKGITKGDVLQYYLKIAPALLPHLKDRPITVERFPDGIGEGTPRFWQKNTPTYYPDWIARVALTNDEGKTVEYALINDEQTLMYFVNQGVLTFHAYFSRVANLDRPDFVILDLDPGEATFSDVVTIAKALHRKLGDEAFVKTSGKSGLHIAAKWNEKGGYNEARAWVASLASEVVAELPEIATMQRFKAARNGRVYVDVMQNSANKHVVPPYVLRATESATVSMPLNWKEVNARLSPENFDMKTTLTRVKKNGDLWHDLVTMA